MQFQIVSSTVIPDGQPVDNRTWLQHFRDWLASRDPVPMYRIERALFYTHAYKPLPGTILTLENGTQWLVTHQRSFCFYANSVTLLQKEDIDSSHAYKGIAVEGPYVCPENQEEIQLAPNV